MNRSQLELIRNQNLRKVELLTYRPRVNAVEIAVNNSFGHEYAKFLSAWMIRNGVRASQLPRFFAGDTISIKDDVENFIEKYSMKFEHNWERPEIITECRLRNEGRWDMFVLDTGERVEIVASSQLAKKPYDDKTVVIMI